MLEWGKQLLFIIFYVRMGVTILPLVPTIFAWILERLRQCGIFCF